MSQNNKKMEKHGLSEADLLLENGHRFVEVAKLGLKHAGVAPIVASRVARTAITNHAKGRGKAGTPVE